jgi:hypothetical protein
MIPEKFKRKLAAILSVDVKGYSRLMGEDEEGTIRTLNAYLEVMTGFIEKHRGRVVVGGRAGGEQQEVQYPQGPYPQSLRPPDSAARNWGSWLIHHRAGRG